MSSVVLSSIETFDGDRCVDIFRREDGTFGFDEFRRDPETKTGWFRTGHFEMDVFAARDEALEAAKQRVIWLDEALKILAEHNKN
ncbi:MAG: hypothetical protein GKS01_17900 [Alphaproteobacteria bacterium]|nr:hypothetical protein [Alphaproteobacteria bacterium]